MSAEIDAQKLDLLRKAFPKGLSAGDGGFSESRGTPDAMNAWPQFRSATTQSKAYNSPFFDTATPTPLQQIPKTEQLLHPWKITIENRSAGSTPEFQYRIEPQSKLYKSLGGDELSVTGADGEWRDAQEGFYLIVGKFSTTPNPFGYVQIQSAEIEISETYQVINTEQYLLAGGVSFQRQTQFRIPLAYAFLLDEEYVIRQQVFQNLTLFNVCYNGIPAQYPIST